MNTLLELPLSYVKKKIFKDDKLSNDYENKFNIFLRIIEILEKIEMYLLEEKTNAAGMFILCSK